MPAFPAAMISIMPVTAGILWLLRGRGYSNGSPPDIAITIMIKHSRRQ